MKEIICISESLLHLYNHTERTYRIVIEQYEESIIKNYRNWKMFVAVWI